MEEDPNDIVLCECVHYKFQTHQCCHIALGHIGRYRVEDIGQYTIWFESQVQGLNIGEPQLEIASDP